MDLVIPCVFCPDKLKLVEGEANTLAQFDPREYDRREAGWPADAQRVDSWSFFLVSYDDRGGLAFEFQMSERFSSWIAAAFSGSYPAPEFGLTPGKVVAICVHCMGLLHIQTIDTAVWRFWPALDEKYRIYRDAHLARSWRWRAHQFQSWLMGRLGLWNWWHNRDVAKAYRQRTARQSAPAY